MKKSIVEVLVCMLLIGTCFVITTEVVRGPQDGDYTYTVNNGEATLTGYTGTGGAITIPSTLGGYPTVAIGDSAFNSVDGHLITAVIIPDTVTTIGNLAFRYCSALTSVTIPDSVISIGNDAFDSCDSLSSVTIPDSVTTLGSSVFGFCSSLTTITIPDSITTIPDYTFYSCTSLTSFTIGSSITSIGFAAFYDCSVLTSITFLGLVAPTTVGPDWIQGTPAGIRGHAYAASNFPAPGNTWYGLTMGTIFEDYTYTVSNGEATITGYTGTGGAITIPSTLGGYPTVAIGDSAFNSVNGHLITAVIIPDTVTTIGNLAFRLCSALTSVIIPDSVISIGNDVFRECTSLSSVTIPDSVTTLGTAVFSFCSSLTTITIPDSITTIPDYTFYSCTSLTSVTLPASVTIIGGNVFFDCSVLTSITFLGLVAPTTVGPGWIQGTPAGIRGHAYAASNFPAPGITWYGLTMGEYLVEQNKPPVAGFTWTPSNPTINQEITFNASASSDLDGSITKYEWDWNNDGTYEEYHSTPTATYSWAQPGNYSVKLQVTDNNGTTNTKTLSVTVSSGGGGGTSDTDNKGTPGFELIFVIGAIAIAFLLWRKKRNI